MLTCLIIKCVNSSALCHTKQHSGCLCHEEYAGFVLFLPFSHCSNCSLVFLRKSNVQLQERRQKTLIWNTKSRPDEGAARTAVRFARCRFPCRKSSLWLGFPVWWFAHRHTHRLPPDTCCGVSQLLLRRREVAAAGWRHLEPLQLRQCPAQYLHRHQTPLRISWPKNPAEVARTMNVNCVCAKGVAGGWGHRETGSTHGASRDLSLQLLPRSQSHTATLVQSSVLLLKLWMTMGSH